MLPLRKVSGNQQLVVGTRDMSLDHSQGCTFGQHRMRGLHDTPLEPMALSVCELQSIPHILPVPVKTPIIACLLDGVARHITSHVSRHPCHVHFRQGGPESSHHAIRRGMQGLALTGMPMHGRFDSNTWSNACSNDLRPIGPSSGLHDARSLEDGIDRSDPTGF